jgi:hypothetical protein
VIPVQGLSVQLAEALAEHVPRQAGRLQAV